MFRESRRPRARGGLIFFSVVLVASVAFSNSRSEAATPDDLCAPQIQEFTQVQAQIRAHNANRYVGPAGPAANAYNARAAALNARSSAARTKAQACLQAFIKLLTAHPSGNVRVPSRAVEKKIDTAVRNVSAAERSAVQRSNPSTYDFLKYGPGKRGMSKRVDSKEPPRLPPSVQNVYKALDKDRPAFPITEKLQGSSPPRLGSRDAAYGGGQVIRAYKKNPNGVVMDHIIPLRRIVAMPGFLQLTPRNMYIVANSPANAQWLSVASNGSKGSGSTFMISGAKPSWIADQQRLRERAAKELQELIQALLKSQ
jgi:hypothetical protein